MTLIRLPPLGPQGNTRSTDHDDTVLRLLRDQPGATIADVAAALAVRRTVVFLALHGLWRERRVEPCRDDAADDDAEHLWYVADAPELADASAHDSSLRVSTIAADAPVSRGETR